jgi:TolA-binding protein
MKLRLCLPILAAMGLRAALPATEGVQNPAVLDAAKPLEQGLPDIAVVKLRALLGRNMSAEDWRAGAEKLSEALIASGDANQALLLLDDSRLRDSEGGRFLRAQALARLQRFREALALYEDIAAGNRSSFRKQALFGAAEMLRALNRAEEALHRLSALADDEAWHDRVELRAAELWLDQEDSAEARRCLASIRPQTTADRQMKRFLEARLEIVEQHPERALQILEPATKHVEGAPPAMIVATLFTIADIHLQLRTAETADDYLEDFIDHYPNNPDLSRVFAKLDEVYRAERKPARTQLDHWTHQPEQPRRALAQWYLARLDLRAGRRERAYRLLAELRHSHPSGATVAPAMVEFAQMHLEDGRPAETLAILVEARALWPDQALLDRIDLMVAQAHYRVGETELATQGFERVGYSDSSFAKTSLFNAAVGRLKLNDKAQFAADYSQLAKNDAGAGNDADLRLEQSLSDAAKGDEHAMQSLGAFIRDFPNDPRVSEAWVALAELNFHRTPAALEEARKDLGQARGAHPTTAALERADYLAIWLEDSSENTDSNVIDLASRFLKQYPDSVLVPEVRMKLAETYYRRQDFSNAQTHFELLAQKNPGSHLAEKALFFAGESAMASMGQNSLERAVVLFNQVIELKGELRWTARNEQASIERKLGKPQNALLLYDEVIKSEARPSDKREALCGKGDIYFELGSADAKNFQLAAAAYDQLAREAPEAAHWRNQALFKKALCLEKIADRGGALSIFYDILEKQSRVDRPPELFWFYKAGFDAARLLEDEEKWMSAAAIYKRLVAVAGPRSEEASARLNRLRLEHFLWEE